MSNSRLEIDTRVVKLLNESSDSTTFDEDTRYELINEIQESVCKGDLVDITKANEPVFKSPFLRFLAKKQFLKSVSDITVPDIEITDTEITLTTTYLSSSGYIYVNWDIIQYTAKTDTQITGVTWISTSHKAGEIAKQAYLLPTDAYKWFDLKQMYDDWEKKIDFLDDRAVKDKPLYWTLVFDDTTENEFIVIDWVDQDDETLVFYYYKTSTDLSSDSDATDLPDKYWVKVIAPIVAWHLLYYTDEQNKGIWYLRDWYGKLKEMYINFWVRTKEFRKKVKTSSWDMQSVWWRWWSNTIYSNNCNR